VRAAYAVCLKDLRVFLESWRAMALALVLPSVLVLLIGQIRTTPTTFQVLLASASSDDEPTAAAVAALLGESSSFDVTTATGPVSDPLEVLQERNVDLLCVFDAKGAHAYSGVTDPFRAALLQRAVENLRAALQKSTEWTGQRDQVRQKLAEAATGIERATDVFVRTAEPVTFQAERTALAAAAAAWSRLAASLSSPDAGNGRDAAALVWRLTARLNATLASKADDAATLDVGLWVDVESLRAALELVSRLQPRTQAADAQLATLKQAAVALAGINDAVASKLHQNRMQEFNAAGALAQGALKGVPVALIESEWYERLSNATSRARPLMEARSREVFEPRAVAEIVREARDVARGAKAGDALAPAAFPTFLNSIAARAPDPSLTLFYPIVTQRPKALLPEIIALVACFIPFVLAVQALLREREEHTIEILLSAPQVSPSSLFVGKLGLPLLCGLFNFGLNVVLVQSVHGLYVKPGLASIVVVVVPAALSSALIGIAASAWVRSAAHATIVSAVYLLVVTLFSGFLYPIASQDPRAVVAVSSVSPLTFVHPSMKAWLFGAPVHWVQPFGALLLHCIAAASLAAFAYRRWLRSI
jgi:hypothetical protein